MRARALLLVLSLSLLVTALLVVGSDEPETEPSQKPATVRQTTDINEEIEGVLITALIGLVFYFVTFLITEGIFIWWLKERGGVQNFRLTIEVLFFAFLFLFLALRMFWIVLRVYKNLGDSEFVLNRLANLCFLTVFTSVLFAWIELIHSTTVSSDRQYSRFLTGASRAYLIVNVVIYIFQFTVIGILVAKTPAQREDSPLYFINTIVMESLFAILAICFLFYGFRLFQLVRTARQDGSLDHSAEESSARLFRILLATAGFTICFLERVVIFTWEPVTGNILNPSLFLALGYLVPEVVPCWIGLLIFSHYGFEPSVKDLISTLYDDYEPLEVSTPRLSRSINASSPDSLLASPSDPFDDRLSMKSNSSSHLLLDQSYYDPPQSPFTSTSSLSPIPVEDQHTLLARALGGYAVHPQVSEPVPAESPPHRVSLLGWLAAQHTAQE